MKISCMIQHICIKEFEDSPKLKLCVLCYNHLSLTLHTFSLSHFTFFLCLSFNMKHIICLVGTTAFLFIEIATCNWPDISLFHLCYDVWMRKADPRPAKCDKSGTPVTAGCVSTRLNYIGSAAQTEIAECVCIYVFVCTVCVYKEERVSCL